MLKNYLAVMFSMALTSVAFGQHGHSDVTFGYDDPSAPTELEIEQDAVTSEGIKFYEAGFVEDASPAILDYFSDNPGFATEDPSPEEPLGLLFNTGDQVWATVLDAGNASNGSSLGVGYVNFFNPSTGMLEANHRIQVGEDATGGTTDVVLNGAAVESGDVSQLIGTANGDGEVHAHVEFDLLDDATAPFGAYGLLLQVEADFASNGLGSTDLTSDPFWVIFNHGLSETVYEEQALAAFGVVEAVPEPTSAAVLFGAFGALALRRRRRA